MSPDHDAVEEGLAIAGGLVLAISGPSTVGKSKVINELMEADPALRRSISATTRKARKDEVNGRDYIFCSEEEFAEAIEQGRFLHWTEGPLGKYGIPLSLTLDLLGNGCTVVADWDPGGVEQVKRAYENVCSVFLLPPSLEEVKTRLSLRGKDRGILSENDLGVRLGMAVEYISKADLYDYVLVNTDVHRCTEAILKIVSVENLKIEKLTILRNWQQHELNDMRSSTQVSGEA